MMVLAQEARERAKRVNWRYAALKVCAAAHLIAATLQFGKKQFQESLNGPLKHHWSMLDSRQTVPSGRGGEICKLLKCVEVFVNRAFRFDQSKETAYECVDGVCL